MLSLPNGPGQGLSLKKLELAVSGRAAELATEGLLIEQWDLDDVGAEVSRCGRDGSPTKVKRIQSVVLKGSGYEEFAGTEEDVARLVHQLIEDHTIG